MTGSAGALRLAAPAKLNLYLHVLGRRPDGYHRLDSLVAFADIADEVTVAPAEHLTLAVTGPFASALGGDDGAAGRPEAGTNLVLRAARALAAAAGTPARAAILLRKNLPVAAGLGGGSSDAAATLRLLARLWGLPEDPSTLMPVAAGLGADVPMCLLARPLFAGGVGERIAARSVSLPAVSIVLVNPNRPLATPAVFRRFSKPFSRPARFAGPATVRILSHRRNDLTEAAASLEPAIPDILAALAAAGSGFSRMSGSGATCFGLFADAATAGAAAERISSDSPGWWVRAGRLLTEPPRLVDVASLQQ